MYESGAPWTLMAADGTSVGFNDGGMFVLETVTGFDSPNVRTNVEDLPEQDGAAFGAFYFGSRPVTLQGKIVAASAAGRNVAVVLLQRALRGLRGSVTLYSQPQGLPAMQAYARLDNARVTGGFVKDFIISLVCADPLVYSQALNTQSGTGQVATSGAAFPLVFPINFGGGSGATVTITATNAGNFDAPVVLRVTGPVTNPNVKNATTGETLFLDNVDLAGGEYVDIDVNARTVTKSDGSNLYSRVRFPTSTWWRLLPGANTVELRSSSAASSATLAATWRDVWS